jgi:hypothetical protein
VREEGRGGEGKRERGGEGDASARTHLKKKKILKNFKKLLFLFFFASARTQFLPRRRMVKTRPWVKPRTRS